MVTQSQSYGRKAEDVAARQLKQSGYKIIERNFRNEIGEIDIIAMERKTTVFVEVKARKNSRFGSPKRAVTLQKQRKISMVALAYLKTHGKNGSPARFDVVSVSGPIETPEIEIVKNAFELAYT